MSPALAAQRPIPTLLGISELLWSDLTAFGTLAPEPGHAATHADVAGLEGYLRSRLVMAIVVLETLETQAGLRLVERAPYRLGLGDWAPGSPLAGYTGGDGGLLPSASARSQLTNVRMDTTGNRDGRFGRIMRSMLWIAANDSVRAAVHYGFDLLERGSAADARSVAHATACLLGARSHASSDTEVVSRIRGAAEDSRNGWLAFYPELDWFDMARLSPAMQDLEMELVERVIVAIEDAREAVSLDAFLTARSSVAKLVSALRLVIRWTNETIPIALEAFCSQLDEIDADYLPTMVAVELGSFQGAHAYAKSIADAYRATVGADWQARFWSERLLVPYACGDLTADAVPPEWVVPSWRIAQAWTVWASFADDAMLVRSRFPDGTASKLDDPRSEDPEAGAAALAMGLQDASKARERGRPDEAEALLNDLLVDYPWADPAWCELAHVVHGRGDNRQALTHLSAALTLRPHSREPWRALSATLDALGHDEEARIAAVIHDRLPDSLGIPAPGC